MKPPPGWRTIEEWHAAIEKRAQQHLKDAALLREREAIIRASTTDPAEIKMLDKVLRGAAKVERIARGDLGRVEAERARIADDGA